MITADRIHEAIDRGFRVCYRDDGEILSNEDGDLFLYRGGEPVLLTIVDGVPSALDQTEIYGIAQIGLLDRNRNGTAWCPQCHLVVILFDGEDHTCMLENWLDQ